VRHDQADEADHARHRHRGTDEKRRREEDGAAHALDLDAERRGALFAGCEQVQCRRVTHQRHRADRRVDADHRDQRIALCRQRPHHPEEHALRLTIAGDRVHQHDERGGERVRHDAGQEERVRRRAPAGPRHEHDAGDGRERAREGRERNQRRHRIDPEHERRRAGDGRTAADAEDVRVGERVREQALEARAGRGEARAHDGRQQHTRNARLHDDRVVGRGTTARSERTCEACGHGSDARGEDDRDREHHREEKRHTNRVPASEKRRAHAAHRLSRMDAKGYGCRMTFRRLRPLVLTLLLAASAAHADDVVFRALDIGEPLRAATAVTAPIYNGDQTLQFPAVVAVGVVNSDQSAGLCSGTLVTPTVVLTAGHCLSFGLTRAAIAIFPDGVTEVDRSAFAAAVHPDFTLSRIAVADVGVLVIDPPITDVTPLPLVSTAPRPRVRATIVGFGDDPRAVSNVKRVGTVRLTRCPRAVRRVGISPGQLSGSLCWRPKRRGQDTCQGDSGGPLLVGGAVAGVTSGGFPDCPGKLSWDTSVASVRDWIELALAKAATLAPTQDFVLGRGGTRE
jgi:hypothetical protein